MSPPPEVWRIPGSDLRSKGFQKSMKNPRLSTIEGDRVALFNCSFLRGFEQHHAAASAKIGCAKPK